MSISFLLIIFLIQASSLTSINCLNKNLRKIEENQELSNDIVIVHVNDVHCATNDTIGYDGLKLYIDELKKKYKNVITVDVGDHIQGGRLGAVSSGEAIIDIMNKIDFDVACLGNHEFDYGIDQLKVLEEKIKNKYICANFCYRKNQSTIFKPYKTIEAGGKNISFIGVLTPLTFSKTYLTSIFDEDGAQLYDFLAGNNSQRLSNRIQEYINEVRNNGSDYVILLTHIGMKEEEYTSDGLLSNLKNVTAVLDAHTHKVYNKTSEDKDGNDIHITQTGTKLENVGLLILKEDGSIISENIGEIPEPSDNTSAKIINRNKKDRWVDKNMSEFIDNLWDEYKDEFNTKIGYSNFDFIVNHNENGTRILDCRTQECNLGNLVADAIRELTNSDIALLNGGAVKNNMMKGNLTRGQVIDALPWFTNIVVKQLPGQTILDALEFGVSQLPKESGGFLQVSGLTYEVDTRLNSSVLADESGMFLNITGKRKVSNVKVNGKDLNLTKLYNTSFRDFLAFGGDGYSMFTPYEITNESIFTDTDAFAQYIEYNLNGTIPETYKDYQGRIKIYNKTETETETETEIETEIETSHNSLLPNLLLLGFDNYDYLENQKLVKFLAYLRLFGYSNKNLEYIILSANTYNNRLLRNLEEIEIKCDKTDVGKSDIYIFNCSKEIDSPISRIQYINNSIKINGENSPNIQTLNIANLMGNNIQNQKGNILSKDTYILDNSSIINENSSFIIEGFNSETDLTSSNAELSFVKNNQLKNIPCNIEKETEKDKYQISCNSKSLSKTDLNLNNLVKLKDQNKSVIISFLEGNSTANTGSESFNYFRLKKSNKKLSGGAITAIILSLVAALIIFVAVCLAINPSIYPTNQHLPEVNSSTNIIKDDIKK